MSDTQHTEAARTLIRMAASANMEARQFELARDSMQAAVCNLQASSLTYAAGRLMEHVENKEKPHTPKE